MLRDLSLNLSAKFSATTLSYCMVKIACLNDSSEIFELEGQSLQRKDKKSRGKEGAKKKIKTLKT